MRHVIEAVQHSWIGATSYWPERWSTSLPEAGQCLVTALVVQDYLGGELRRCKVGRHRHFWNVLRDGTELDLTAGQFDLPHERTEVEAIQRHRLLKTRTTRDRYHLLKRRVEEELQ